MKATITAAVGEHFFLKTQEMVDNLLKIEYFHQKKLLCIHYLCTNISAKFYNIRCDTFFLIHKNHLFSGGQTSCAP